MDDAMRLPRPRWMSRRDQRYRQPVEERAPDPEAPHDPVMADLGRLTMQLADAVERIKRTVPDDKDDS